VESEPAQAMLDRMLARQEAFTSHTTMLKAVQAQVGVGWCRGRGAGASGGGGGQVQVPRKASFCLTVCRLVID